MFTRRCASLALSLACLAGAVTPVSGRPDEPATPAPAAPAAAPALTPLAHVETRGSGPVAMVLIPGLTCDWTVWEAFMERNKDKYTMYAVTLPGFAGTEAPPAPADNTGTPWLDNAATAVVKMVEEKKLDKPVVVGHSLGGLLAFRIAIESGDKFSGVVAVDGFPAFPLGPNPIPKEQRTQMVDTMIGPQLLGTTDEMWAQQIEMMAKSMIKDQERGKELLEIFKKTRPQVGARYMFELLKSDWSDKLGEAKCPYIAVAALNDDNAAQGMGKDMMRGIWTSSLGKAADTVVFVDDSRHFITEDQPKALDEAVENFVKTKAAKKE